MLAWFRLTKVRATYFRPERIVASFLYLIVFLSKVLPNHSIIITLTVTHCLLGSEFFYSQNIQFKMIKFVFPGFLYFINNSKIRRKHSIWMILLMFMYNMFTNLTLRNLMAFIFSRKCSVNLNSSYVFVLALTSGLIMYFCVWNLTQISGLF